MIHLSGKKNREFVEAMLAVDAPDIAYAVYRVPHDPTKYNELRKKEKARVRTYRNTVYEFLTVFEDKEKKKEFLEKNSDFSYFLETFEVKDEALKRANKELASNEELNKIGEDATADLDKCSSAIEESFGKIKTEDFIEKLFKLNRPDLAYGVFKTGHNPLEGEMKKNIKKAFSFAIMEFLNYIDCYKDAIGQKKVDILKDYLKNHGRLAEFFKQNKEDLSAFFLPPEE